MLRWGVQLDKLTFPNGRGAPLLEWQVHMNVLEIAALIVDPHFGSFIFILNFEIRCFHVLEDFVVLVFCGEVDLISRGQ